ncbi:MAG: Gfo/Idh/MocA family protein [Planctomycetota bacterium]|jgi:predicted dehydrogenase
MSNSLLHVAMIGSKFMGRAHANAWMSVNRFFDLPLTAVRSIVCARDKNATRQFAQRWGFDAASTDWKRTIADEAIDLVDVCTPNHLHAEPSLAALAAGKHVACEKPLAGTLAEARTMRDAAKKAKRKGVHTFVWYNYRRCPAVAYAHQLVASGRLGRIFHVRACYLQDWGGPDTPMLWRFDAKKAGSGAHGDLNAHIIDMARFITGDEFAEVSGAIEHTFITHRDVPEGAGGAISGKGSKKKQKQARSTVDDCVLFLARMKGGAVASFESTRVATGNQNRNTIEINGEHGSIRFDFESMNELHWWDNTLPSPDRGWSRILCTNPGDHPYVENYWPPAHLIGYEHGFISQAADILSVLGGGRPVVPLPDFADAYETQRVLEAALLSARERCAVKMSDVK